MSQTNTVKSENASVADLAATLVIKMDAWSIQASIDRALNLNMCCENGHLLKKYECTTSEKAHLKTIMSRKSVLYLLRNRKICLLRLDFLI
jgi:hypothetical protein